MASEDEACWYILDTRQVVGNCGLWWRPDSQGYTCDLNDAGLYTYDFAFKGRRVSDVPVHHDVARANAFTHVRVEGLWRDEKTCALLTEARDARFEALRREDELSESELHGALDVYPFDDDDEWTVTKLRDEIVTAAKDHACHDCKGTIRESLRHRNRVEKTEGGLVSFRWCHSCTRLHIGYPYGEERKSER